MTDVGRSAPEVYRLSMEKLPLAVGRARRLSLLKLAAGTTALIGALTPFAPSHQDAIDLALVVAMLSFAALPYVLWRAGRRVRRHWNAFELAIGPETVRVAAKGEGRITIRRDEVTQIVEGGTGLLLRSSAPGVVVHVPRTVEGYLDARTRLGALGPIRSRADAQGWCLAVVGAGLAVAAAAPLWARAPGVGGGLVVCQLALAAFASFEIGGHPGLSRAGRALTIAAVVAGGVAPLLGLLGL
jgi:hypothetical protein